jgi:predicted short-subunit dehydrogenase-like oxidoreductase (DUF2520 family)
MADISIIGAGRLGTSLGRALAARGHRIRALSCRSLRSAKESRRAVGRGRPVTDVAQAAALGQVVILCLPDEHVRTAAVRLAGSGIDWRGKTVLHTSGVLPAQALAPLRKKGAAVGSFHPAQSFPEKGMPPSRFRGVTFGLEGDREALDVARGFIRVLGGYPIILSVAAKPLYHAACIMASNYPVILWQAAAGLLARAGVTGRQAVRLIVPLAEGTLRSVMKLDPGGALTGPIIRGDLGTVRAHREALSRSAPELLGVYREVGLAALETAAQRGLSSGKIRAIRALLEGR